MAEVEAKVEIEEERSEGDDKLGKRAEPLPPASALEDDDPESRDHYVPSSPVDSGSFHTADSIDSTPEMLSSDEDNNIGKGGGGVVNEEAVSDHNIEGSNPATEAQLPSNTVARLPTPSPPPSPPAAVSSRVYDLPTGFEDQPKLDVREASIQPLPAKPPIPMDSGQHYSLEPTPPPPAAAAATAAATANPVDPARKKAKRKKETPALTEATPLLDDRESSSSSNTGCCTIV